MKSTHTAYNVPRLESSDVRRVWEEVFLHYRDISYPISCELMVQADGVRKPMGTCTGGLHGTEKQTGKPITMIVGARGALPRQRGRGWRFLGNAGGAAVTFRRKRPSPSSLLRLAEWARKIDAGARPMPRHKPAH